MVLPAFARHCCVADRRPTGRGAADRYLLPPGPQQQTRCSSARRPDETDRHSDARHFHRPCSACYHAGSASEYKIGRRRWLSNTHNYSVSVLDHCEGVMALECRSGVAGHTLAPCGNDVKTRLVFPLTIYNMSRSCSCSLAVLDPRVGHTMDVLSPFIPVLCHSD